MKSIFIKAHERKLIISRFSNSIPTAYLFSATPDTGNQATKDEQVSGIVEVRGSNWIFPKAPVSQKLMADNRVSKSAWDSFYSVYVTPDQDIRIELETGQMKHKLVFFLVITSILAIALAFSAVSLW